MDKVKRKQRKEHPGVRKILPPVLLLLALAVGAIGWFSRQETQKVSVPEKILTAGTIEQRETGSVYSIDVHLASGERERRSSETSRHMAMCPEQPDRK